MLEHAQQWASRSSVCKTCKTWWFTNSGGHFQGTAHHKRQKEQKTWKQSGKKGEKKKEIKKKKITFNTVASARSDITEDEPESSVDAGSPAKGNWTNWFWRQLCWGLVWNSLLTLVFLFLWLRLEGENSVVNNVIPSQATVQHHGASFRGIKYLICLGFHFLLTFFCTASPSHAVAWHRT